MLSPAAQYVLRSTAQLQEKSGRQPYAYQYANQYEFMLCKLAEDKRRLKAVQSMQKKSELKRALLPDYQPWVEGVLQSASGTQDDVVMTVMVWCIDAGDFVGAVQIARYALTYKLSLPDQYQRTPACLLAEEFAEAVFRARITHQQIDLESLSAIERLTANEDMPDPVRAKLHKALAYGLIAKADITLSEQQTALQHLKRAWQLHDKVGVKKDIEALERTLKKTLNINKNSFAIEDS